ncbi:hypothetical protein C5C05_15885, partial [Clavibacter michiganensis]|uniref:DUF7507 domain-containing protein n=1 Tax=Clavibacter michiganensis TaxID=28447 RepID=UPI000D44AB9D
AGKVDNVATGAGTPPGGTPVAETPPSNVTVPIDPAPGLTMTKSANPTAAAKVGDAITYSFLFTNTGNTTLANIMVNETQFSGTGELSAIDYPTRTLAPGAMTTAIATYIVTQADVDAGKVDNAATGAGTPPGDTPVTQTPPSEVTVPIEPAPAITIAKSGQLDGAFAAGQTVTYSFVITNTGNTTLTGVTVDEAAFSGTGSLSDVSYPTRSLAAGEQTTATATYVLTQADIDAGEVTNSATATGTPPGNTPPPTSPPSDTRIPGTQTPSLSIVKSADPGSIAKAGETVDYSFVITNTGNVTMTDLMVNETQFSGTGAVTAISYPTRTLAPGASTTATASYVATQADVDAGSITNTATATGTPPSGVPTTSDPSSAIVTAGAAPGLTMTKSANPTAVSKAGETITYSFLFTNTGNTTLTNITVNETSFSGTGELSPIDYPTRTLAPGATTTATATYVVTQADADAGKVDNAAAGAGTPPGDTPVVETPPSEV